MDHSLAQTAIPADEDEWDTEGFVIPSLGIEDSDQNKTDIPKLEDSKPTEVEAAKEEHIYLGPHGAPPSLVKQQEQKSSSRKQKFRQKLKEADRVNNGGRENKVDSLRELVGGGKMAGTASKTSPRDWLDPHCHESQFERRHLH
ncbi:Na-translocating NADH-quinone reductase subunit A [Perilla frutescens var. hirtella]|uniref:Na-translocating NADH-quinone reductase subunit A n=1 Tax=Perilla frutescens var. hirtella TaxID=608512 RepID=A0AAD4PDZ9_PERFH|nr:Na-translocating NADH-quinone reductase subunit A [Perilla frutescens var. frutescens]KAH6835660.1 Na-translocating NADH-quinone reductase subunit A [Perilla frutescens var. hirtella]